MASSNRRESASSHRRESASSHRREEVAANRRFTAESIRLDMMEAHLRDTASSNHSDAAESNRRDIASSNINPDDPDRIHRWIERKPLTEAVAWTSREKFYLTGAVITFKTDWTTIAKVTKKAGEPYRPDEWYTATSCERQFKIIVNSQTSEVKAMKYADMLTSIYDDVLEDFIRDLKKTHDGYLSKYTALSHNINRLRVENATLTKNEVNSLHAQARRNEIEGKQYMEQLRSRQNATLASENSSSASSEEPIKWNAPPAPLLTSLLRSGNTIPPTHKSSTVTSSQLQSPSGTSRTRSGKLMPLSPSIVRTTQGTPTLSKLLEAPANPYIPCPPQSVQKNDEVIGTDLLNGDNPKKENSQSSILNRVQVDTHGPVNQLNKFELSYSKRQTSRSPVSTAKNGSKASSSVVNLLSDSENDEYKNATQTVYPKNVFQFGEKNDVVGSRKILEPRATRSQTRAEGSFKLSNDNKPSGGKKVQEILQQQSEECLLTKSNSVEDVIDIDQIEVDPLSTVHGEVIISPKVTRSSAMQKFGVKNPVDNLSTNKKDSPALEEKSSDFVLNSSMENDVTDLNNIMMEHSQISNTNITGSLVPIDSSALKDTITLRKDGQCFPSPNKTLTPFDGKLLRQKKIIELKNANIKCMDGRNDKTILSFTSQPIVVMNKIKKPFNIKIVPEIKADCMNYDPKRTIRLQSGKQNFVHLLDSQCSYSDEVIIIDDDVNNDNDGQKESSKSESQIMSLKAIVDNDKSNMHNNSKTANLQVDKKTNNDKTLWHALEKPQHLVSMSTKKKMVNQNTLSKSETKNNSQETNNRLIQEVDLDFDQSAMLSELYNNVEDIVEVNPYGNEEISSLIDCGIFVEKRPNTVTLDQDETSVSECDSTIGAFDTFAQLTTVTSKANPSKNIKFVNREIKTAKHDEMMKMTVNDEQGSGVPVTGIPILQGVISDVMSKIHFDRVADIYKSVDSKCDPISEIVEISSDEEEVVMNDSSNLKVVNQNIIQEYDEEVNIKKLNEMKLQTSEDLDTGIKNNYETDISSSVSTISNETKKSDKVNVENNTSNIAMKTVTKNTDNMQSKREKAFVEEKHKQVETKLVSSNDIIKKGKDVVEFRKETDRKSQIDNYNPKLKELMKNTNETEKYQSIDIEGKREQRQHEVNKIKNMEAQVAEETKTNEAEVIQRSRKNEDKKSKIFEMIQLKDTEMKNTRSGEIRIEDVDKTRKTKGNEDQQSQKSRELEVTKINEFENQKIKNVGMPKGSEILRDKDDAALQKANKDEIHLSKEIDLQTTKEVEICTNKITTDIPENIETKKIIDTELITAIDPEIHRVKKESIKEGYEIKLVDEKKKAKDVKEKKVTDIEKNKKIIELKETEFVELVVPEVKSAEHKKNVALLKKDSDIEIKYTNKDIDANVKMDHVVLTSEEESKKTKKLERSLVDSKKENTKELESKTSKLKEQEQPSIADEVVKNKEAQIITRTKGSKVEENLKESNFSSQNLPIKASIVILESFVPSLSDCMKKINNENELVNNNERDNDVSVTFSESTNDVGGKSSPSLKSVDQNDLCTIPRAPIGTKTRISTSLENESPSASSNPQRKISLPQSCSPEEKDDQNTNNFLENSSEIVAADTEHIPQTFISNKRGRKRPNEDLNESNNEKLTPEDGATDAVDDILSSIVIEPLFKKKKENVYLSDSGLSLEAIIQKIKKIYEDNCRDNHIILAIEEQLNMTPTERLLVITQIDLPINLLDIEDQIAEGKILNATALECSLLKMLTCLRMANNTSEVALVDHSVINNLGNIEQFQSTEDDLSYISDDDSEYELEPTDNIFDGSVDDEVNLFDIIDENDLNDDHLQFLNEERNVESDSSSSCDGNDMYQWDLDKEL